MRKKNAPANKTCHSDMFSKRSQLNDTVQQMYPVPTQQTPYA